MALPNPGQRFLVSALQSSIATIPPTDPRDPVCRRHCNLADLLRLMPYETGLLGFEATREVQTKRPAWLNNSRAVSTPMPFVGFSSSAFPCLILDTSGVPFVLKKMGYDAVDRSRLGSLQKDTSATRGGTAKCLCQKRTRRRRNNLNLHS